MAPDNKNSTSTNTSRRDPQDDTTQDTPTTPYASALARLEPLQPLFRGMAHRNHNQHRRAAWWSSLGMLRRQSDKLIAELVAADAAARADLGRAVKAASVRGRKRRREELLARDSSLLVSGSGRTTMAGKVRADESIGWDLGDRARPEYANVSRRAAWLCDVLVPRCHLAFSQLTADNQFATMGVVLLGALAQVQVACANLLPSQEHARPDHSAGESGHQIQPLAGTPTSRCDVEAAAPAASTRGEGSSTVTTSGLGEPKPGGKVISRDAVEQAEKVRRLKREKKAPRPDALTSSAPRASFTQVDHAAATETVPPLVTTSRSTAPGRDSIVDSRPAKKAKTLPEEESGQARIRNIEKGRVKKKKKTSKGDEFDNLFKNLM